MKQADDFKLSFEVNITWKRTLSISCQLSLFVYRQDFVYRPNFPELDQKILLLSNCSAHLTFCFVFANLF